MIPLRNGFEGATRAANFSKDFVGRYGGFRSGEKDSSLGSWPRYPHGARFPPSASAGRPVPPNRAPYTDPNYGRLAICESDAFTLVSPWQFRAKPPPSLQSAEWARDYNEIKHPGAKNRTKRTARQTEDARFWLIVAPRAYNPQPQQIVIAKNMDVLDSARFMARFMALFSIAAADALIAVFDAKYK